MINPRRRHNNCKYLCIQHRSTSIHNKNTNRHKRGNWQWHNNTRRLFNTPLTPIDRSSKQKIHKETQVLNDTLDDMDLIDIFRTFHPNAEEYTFSSAHGTFSRIDHILGHKSNLCKFKKNWNCIKYLLWPQCYETRYQLQEKTTTTTTTTKNRN